jgi:hypothetical protein
MQVLDIQKYACGSHLGLALISNKNPDFEMASLRQKRRPASDSVPHLAIYPRIACGAGATAMGMVVPGEYAEAPLKKILPRRHRQNALSCRRVFFSPIYPKIPIPNAAVQRMENATRMIIHMSSFFIALFSLLGKLGFHGESDPCFCQILSIFAAERGPA